MCPSESPGFNVILFEFIFCHNVESNFTHLDVDHHLSTLYMFDLQSFSRDIYSTDGPTLVFRRFIIVLFPPSIFDSLSMQYFGLSILLIIPGN